MIDDLTPTLDRPAQLHLSRLMRTWAPLADIAFADLLLCVPEGDGPEVGYTVVGHVRPTTSRSIYRTEVVGTRWAPGDRPFFDLVRLSGDIADGGVILERAAPRIRTLTVPVSFRGRTIALLSREFSPDEQREPGELEMNYFFTFRRLAQMIADGVFPFDGDEYESEEAPRVSDGLLVVDAAARVRFASPNAISVLSRIGVRGVEGERLSAAGLDNRAIQSAFSQYRPQVEEISRGDQTVVLRCIPLLESGELTGAVLFVRDISELRRRDRLLLSKDATIAEIHHRVKNNLQTISSLLRLQGRRVVADEARQAIDESVRRIRSIAVVHEILSQEVADDVPFEDLVRPLVRVVEEGFSSPESPVRFSVSGDAGTLPTDVATPFAVVLSELMQNAVEHGFAAFGGGDAEVRIEFASTPQHVDARVRDNGSGVAPDFDLGAQAGLGLTIVRSLVENDLGGSIRFEPGDPGGTTVHIRVPRRAGMGLAAEVGRANPDRG
ncbi:MAG: histidine kinase N-terminal domain-containing protein [Actinomycetota bacterium]